MDQSSKIGKSEPRSKRHVLWTKGEVETLHLLLESKTPVRDIAICLQKTEKAIRRKCEGLCWSSATVYENGARRRKLPQKWKKK